MGVNEGSNILWTYLTVFPVIDLHSMTAYYKSNKSLLVLLFQSYKNQLTELVACFRLPTPGENNKYVRLTHVEPYRVICTLYVMVIFVTIKWCNWWVFTILYMMGTAWDENSCKTVNVAKEFVNIFAVAVVKNLLWSLKH